MKRSKRDEEFEVFRKATAYNWSLIEAIFEILAEKRVLTGEELVERVRKLRDGNAPQTAWVN